jgi:hypothetical protein
MSFYALTILLTKISILLFYLRFGHSQSIRIAIYAVLGVTIAYSVVGIFGCLYVCEPVAKVWNMGIPGKCKNLETWLLPTAVMNVPTDVVILIVPVFILSPLRVPLRQKAALWGVLMTGGL